jgi:CRP/FNR family transcriptional regulator, cyclic AMP receptor protein
MNDSVEDQLARVPLFEGLSKHQLSSIAGLTTRLHEDAATVIAREGATGNEFIVVLEGELEVRHGDEVVASICAGDFVGEIALLDNRPRTATVVAKTPVVIEVISRQEFSALLADAPEVAQEIMARMAQRLSDNAES